MGKGIVVAGALVLDQHYTIASYPQEGLLAKIGEPTQSIGGTGNLIFDLATLDPSLHVQVSATIGQGSHGRDICRALAKVENIDASPLAQEGSTSITYVMNAQDTRQRTFFYYPASSDNYADDDILWEKIDADIFQLDYLFLLAKADKEDPEYGTGCARILSHARSLGMKTSFDAVSENSPQCQHGFKSAARYADYCSINEVEIANGTGIPVLGKDGIDEEAMKKALFRLREWGVTTWAVCHTPAVSYGLDCQSGIVYRCTSLSLDSSQIAGTTGAGDAFCAGILYAAYRGEDLEAALPLASATAACSLFCKDGTSGMREYEEVMRLAKGNKGGKCEKI